jgi:hypothetical protein
MDATFDFAFDRGIAALRFALFRVGFDMSLLMLVGIANVQASRALPLRVVHSRF